MVYNWQQKDWPNFRYDASKVSEAVAVFSVQLERTKAVLSAFDVSTEEGKRLEAMVAEAVSTSAIEGEKLNPQDVMSSMKNRLGKNQKPIAVRDYRATGVANMMLKIRDEFAHPLSEAMLHSWRVRFGIPVQVGKVIGTHGRFWNLNTDSKTHLCHLLSCSAGTVSRRRGLTITAPRTATSSRGSVGTLSA